MSITLSSERYEKIKQIVADMFVKYDVSCVPVNGFEIATKMGIKVIPYSAFQGKTYCLLLKQSEDGFVVENESGERFIFYNDGKEYGRINNTIMHEIGHLVLNHTEDSELAETEVKFFAKYALVPPVLVHKLKVYNLFDVSRIFGVSFEAADYALNYYEKWLRISNSHYTDYEITILNLFANINNGGDAYEGK